MQLLSFAARYFLIGLATFLTFSTLTDWVVTRRISLAMAWGLWNIPIVRVATLSSIALIILSYSLTGERGSWDMVGSQPARGGTRPDVGGAGNDTDL